MEAKLAKVHKGSQTLQRTLDESTKQVCELQQANQGLCAALANVTDKRGHKRSKTCDIDTCSPRHKRRLISQKRVSCSGALDWLKEDGWATQSGSKECQDWIGGRIWIERSWSVWTDAETIRVEQLQVINMMLFVKDKFNISSRAYHELAKVCQSMPRYYKLQQRIGTCGVQQSLEGRLRQRVQHLHHTTRPDASFRQNLLLHVRLSGDGTNIGKRLHVINFTFTLLEEGSLAYSAEGNHPLAIIKESWEVRNTSCIPGRHPQWGQKTHYDSNWRTNLHYHLLSRRGLEIFADYHWNRQCDFHLCLYLV